ncbi:SRPBCC domain-containing protein [Arthrobacter sp. MP_2.3]|uniref:SRPBCC domain-containing protein n=1 Tax=Arthrobacter sp. MP_2.3 TaxID=3349633 RepID=UPI0038D488C0
MNTNTPGTVRILGTLLSADGKGIVRLEDRFDTDMDDLWSALTDPGRLAHWLGTVEGDLRQGGEFSAHYFASGWEGTCYVDECQPPRRLLILTKSSDEPDGVTEVTLTPDGDQTTLVIEDRGLPLEQIAAYGAGNQVHVEDLAAYLAGRGRCDARVRWQELHPAYQELATRLT